MHHLVPVILSDLQRLARQHLHGERQDHTFQPTDLVQEVYLRLARRAPLSFERRSEFFALVAHLMREILIDHARSKHRVKRGGHSPRVTLDRVLGLASGKEADVDLVLSVSEAITRLGQMSQRQQQVVELRCFVGLTLPETAQALELSRATVERDWAVAKRWLARELARR